MRIYYNWYWYDDPTYRPKCPYCNNQLAINSTYDGIHGLFNIYRFYKKTCDHDECLRKLDNDFKLCLYESGIKSLSRVNDSPDHLDYIARSSRSRLINGHDIGYFYIAYTNKNYYKFGVSSQGVLYRSTEFFGDTYIYGHNLIIDKMELVANLEYNLKSVNNWKETYDSFFEFKVNLRKVLNNKGAFKYNPGGLIKVL